ncbi:DUF1801 domain-containing protein [Maritalea sp.]|jgi:hypothetical protein|uniref:DUF1801 domain-containing protein n=1 Tax=Maritalea sp. TaxID=2003361 RepID=UPI0039E6AA7D
MSVVQTLILKIKAKTHLSDIIDQKIGEYQTAHRDVLCQLRALIHQVGANTAGCGQIVEALKWNQISFLTQKPKSGTTIRFDKNSSGTISLYVNCNTSLIERFRHHYPKDFTYIGTREVVLPADLSVVKTELAHMIAMALTYHQNKRNQI